MSTVIDDLLQTIQDIARSPMAHDSIVTHITQSLTPKLRWAAYDDATYDGSLGSLIGYGHTEDEAIRDLIEQMEETEDDKSETDTTIETELGEYDRE